MALVFFMTDRSDIKASQSIFFIKIYQRHDYVKMSQLDSLRSYTVFTLHIRSFQHTYSQLTGVIPKKLQISKNIKLNY